MLLCASDDVVDDFAIWGEPSLPEDDAGRGVRVERGAVAAGETGARVAGLQMQRYESLLETESRSSRLAAGGVGKGVMVVLVDAAGAPRESAGAGCPAFRRRGCGARWQGTGRGKE
jgi:hypothetical protein